MKLLKPKPLKPGDMLGVVAFSTPISVRSEEVVQRSEPLLGGLVSVLVVRSGLVSVLVVRSSPLHIKMFRQTEKGES